MTGTQDIIFLDCGEIYRTNNQKYMVDLGPHYRILCDTLDGAMDVVAQYKDKAHFKEFHEKYYI